MVIEVIGLLFFETNSNNLMGMCLCVYVYLLSIYVRICVFV
jgi:hypothetical protein